MEPNKILKNRITLIPRSARASTISNYLFGELLPTSALYLRNPQRKTDKIKGLKFYIEVRNTNKATVTGTMNGVALKFNQLFDAQQLYVAPVNYELVNDNNVVSINVKFIDNGKQFDKDLVYELDSDLNILGGTDIDFIRQHIDQLFLESNIKEALFEKPLNALGDYSMTGKLIGLGDVGLLPKGTVVAYRDLFERATAKV